jgi:molybdopterin molybdotransferase
MNTQYNSNIDLQTLANNPSCMDDYDPNAMSVTQARQFIKQYLSPVTAIETLPIKACLNRVLAQAIESPFNVPNHNNSAMDGFAFKHQDANKSLSIVGTAFAGKPFIGEIQSGECIKIMTGAIAPSDCNTVVMQEHTQVENNFMHITQCPDIGANIRLAGEDITQGQSVLSKGHVIKPADLGLLASLGIATANVFMPLKVAFFSTGDELVSVGSPLQQGQIYDSNRYTLFGMLTHLGAEVTDLGSIPDQPALLESTLLNAATMHDVVITSGGVSVGEADYMKTLLQQHGQVLFWKINMKPGRPLAYGKVKHAHYFGLPGNPVSTMITFYQFVRQALLTLMGADATPIPCFRVECTSAIKKATGRTEYQRGLLFKDGANWKVKALPNQGSGVLSSMSQANCFIVLDESTGNSQAGELVFVQPFEGVM